MGRKRRGDRIFVGLRAVNVGSLLHGPAMHLVRLSSMGGGVSAIDVLSVILRGVL